MVVVVVVVVVLRTNIRNDGEDSSRAVTSTTRAQNYVNSHVTDILIIRLIPASHRPA